MTLVRYSRRARREILTIVKSIAADNPRAAEVFEDGIENHCSLLARTPQMGRLRPDVGPSIRSLPHGSYLVFYRFSEERGRVTIVSVRHGRRTLPWLDDTSSIEQ